MSDVQMFWPLCVECMEFLSQKRSRAFLMESRCEKVRQKKQGLYQIKRSDDSRIARQLFLLALIFSSKAEEIKANIANAINIALIRLAQITRMATKTTITTKAVGRLRGGKVDLIR